MSNLLSLFENNKNERNSICRKIAKDFMAGRNNNSFDNEVGKEVGLLYLDYLDKYCSSEFSHYPRRTRFY